MSLHIKLASIATAPPDALRFLSVRGMSPYIRVRECVEKIFGTYNFAQAQKLGELLDPYALDDQLSVRLQKQGLRLEAEGVVPFASLKSYIDAAWLDRANEKAFTVWEIKDFFAREGLKPTTLYLAPESLQILKSLPVSTYDLWRELEYVDALECHRNPILCFSASRLS
jgi:hypothetical protein